MASATEWFHDFCLSCDRQTTDGAYCSQACRLVDLEKAGASEPASPRSYSSSISASSYGSTGSAGSSGFYLSPAFNFSAYKSSPSSPRPSSSTTTQQTYFQPSSSPTQYAASSYDRQAKRSLATSSSRASLSSVSSASSTQGLSDHALYQLRSYVSSFDQTRDMRRRMTYG